MKRKTSTVPTRIWKFRCYDPTEGAELVERQVGLQLRYYNELVRIERERRGSYRRITAASGAAADVAVRLLAVTTEIEILRAQTRAARAEARKRVPAVSATKDRIRALAAEAKAFRLELKAARRSFKEDARAAFFVSWCDHLSAAAVRRARAESGLYWGNYLVVEGAVDNACKSKVDPSYRETPGPRCVTVQLQGGLPVSDLLAGTDTQLRLLAGQTKRGEVRLRVGTGPDGRSPVWATFPVIVHRQLPPDGNVKWAWVQRERVGARWHWYLCLMMESLAFATVVSGGNGAVAIDVGWRLRPDRVIRYGYYADDRGNHGELCLPGSRNGIHEKLEHVISLGVIRDRAFNEARSKLKEWLKGAGETAPEGLRRAAETLPHWTKPGRLSELVTAWRDRRFTGDSEIYAVLEAWRRQDKHLSEWEANERVKTLARRSDLYRHLACQLGQTYDTVVLEDFDLRQTQRRARPEEGKEDLPQPARYQQRVAAVSGLRQCLAERLRVVEVDKDRTTSTCSACDGRLDFPREDLHVTCPGCGRTWDQDHNAALNILKRHLAASGPAVPPREAPGSGEITSTSTETPVTDDRRSRGAVEDGEFIGTSL